MIAKQIPEIQDVKGKKSDVARAYGLSIEEFTQASLDFLQCEGYDSNVKEYNTLHDWLIGNHKEMVDNTPWQKGDDLNDFSGEDANFFSKTS